MNGLFERNEAQGLLKADTSGKHMLDVFQEAVGNSQPCYVNSQALGIDTNDEIERFILKETFGDKVPITSIKGMMGHAFGAMGAIQMISSPALNGIWIYPSYDQIGKWTWVSRYTNCI